MPTSDALASASLLEFHDGLLFFSAVPFGALHVSGRSKQQRQEVLFLGFVSVVLEDDLLENQFLRLGMKRHLDVTARGKDKAR